MRTHRTLALACILAASLVAPACKTASRAPAAERPLAAIQAVDVAYAGELHDDLAQHAYQLEMLRAMTEAAKRDGTPMLLGMEMFQRPFQKHLDDYVAGRIPEREMLRRTQYFERWRYDHTMYAPLWQYCRANGVRVVALNADRDITRAVSRGGGLDALDARQRAQIADEIDLTVAAHRERIMDVFQSGAHPMPEEALQGMYEAMTVWDETMAESAAEALTAAGPGARMLVIAGSQHIQEFTGIPDRVSRRLPDSTRAVVVLRTLDDEEGEAEPESAAPAPETEATKEPSAAATEGDGQDGEGDESEDAAPAREPSDEELGDFVVWLQPVEAQPPTRLGVNLRNEPVPEGLLITGVADDSNASRAGLLADDVIQWVGDARITDMTDLRYTLDRTRLGTTVTVRVLRDGHPLAVEITFEPPPPPPET